MLRNVLVTLGSLCFVLAPTLCAAGLLTHDCDCAAAGAECEDCCGGEPLGCDCVDEGCSHDSCANDPCQVAIPQGQPGKIALDLAGKAAFSAHDPFLARAFTFLQRLATAHRCRPGSDRNVPYPLSDLPLLV